MNDSADVVIVGGGVIGCTTALYLARRGVTATVVEMSAVASGASGKAAGILTPYSGSCDPGLLALSPATLELHAELAASLPEITGIDHGYDERPHLRIAIEDEDVPVLADWQSKRRAEGFESKWLEPRDAKALTDWLTADFVAAIECDFEPTVDSYAFTTSVWAAAEKGGARLVQGRVTGLLAESGRRAAGVKLDDGSTIHAGHMVIASGPWAGEAGEWLGFPVAVRPQKGQLLYLAPAEGGETPVSFGAMVKGGVVLPKRLSGTIVGATREEAGFDTTPTREARDEILAVAARLTDRIDPSDIVEQTACLRPIPADGVPLVGTVPGWERVYLATGHWSEGIHFAPVTGKWIADMIVDGDSEHDFTALDPARFASAA